MCISAPSPHTQSDRPSAPPQVQPFAVVYIQLFAAKDDRFRMLIPIPFPALHRHGTRRTTTPASESRSCCGSGNAGVPGATAMTHRKRLQPSSAMGPQARYPHMRCPPPRLSLPSQSQARPPPSQPAPCTGLACRRWHLQTSTVGVWCFPGAFQLCSRWCFPGAFPGASLFRSEH